MRTLSLDGLQAAGITPGNHDETMRLLGRVVMETSKKQENVMDKLVTLTQAAAKRKASSERIVEQMGSMKQHVARLEAMGKLATAVKSVDGKGTGKAEKPAAPLTPPHSPLEELTAEASRVKGEL